MTEKSKVVKKAQSQNPNGQAEARKPIVYAISQIKINNVKMTLSKMNFNLETHQQLQGLIDYLIKNE